MTQVSTHHFLDLNKITSMDFDQLANEGYLILENFLNAEQCQMITTRIAELQQSHALKKAHIGRQSELSFQPQIRGDLIHWLEPNTENILEKKLFQDLFQLQNLLSRELFLPLKKFEIHFALYPPGTGYERHYDQHKNQPYRLITFVLYLNKDWNDSCGGELVIYNSNNDELIRVSPTLGKLILFQSALFPHAVLPSSRDRQSLTGWFRNDT